MRTKQLFLVFACLVLVLAGCTALNPKVDRITPANAATSIPTDTKITVVFNQPMDQPSVENSFSITPAVKGKLTWEGNTLVFTPEGRLQPKTAYSVKVGPEAKNQKGQKIGSEYVATFTTLEATQLKVYFTKEAQWLVPEIREVPGTISDAQELAVRAVEQLLQGTSRQDISSEIPQGTKLLGLRVNDGVAYVDFSREIISYGGGTAQEDGIIGQVVYTLTEIPEIKLVQFLVEGKPVVFPEGSATDQPLGRADVNYQLAN